MSGVMKAMLGLLILCAIVIVISVTALLVALGYAEKLDDGTILRVSTTQNSVVIILLGLLQPMIVIVVLALIISVFLS